ncbi:hypothetical protein [Actinoplanes sp. URMC 104]|uniref:hypothetical protein n=1 Tax=Actinoplanes sp. URMC 104 TaxID=3423409 RepID=UPI003F1D2A13
MNRLVKRAAITVTAAAAFLGVASPAMAVQWGSASDPYYVKEDNVNQGKGYGDYGNYNFQYARSNAWYYDMKAGGQGIYAVTNFFFYYSYAGQPAAWHSEQYSETSRTTSAAWKFQSKQKALLSEAEKSRGEVKVCEDQSFSGDPCSAKGLPSFSY